MDIEMPYNCTELRMKLKDSPVNSSIIKLNERSQSSVAHPSDTAIKLLVTAMLQHVFMEKINDSYMPQTC
jgi:hypothetical protein